MLIKNRIGQIPFGRRPSIKDRAGTITKITKKRVHITTCNGTNTSRAPHNITHLSQTEYEEINGKTTRINRQPAMALLTTTMPTATVSKIQEWMNPAIIQEWRTCPSKTQEWMKPMI